MVFIAVTLLVILSLCCICFDNPERFSESMSLFICFLADQAIQMVIMSGTATVLQQFVSGLKSRNEDTRAKSAKDLQHYVTTELREVTA